MQIGFFHFGWFCNCNLEGESPMDANLPALAEKLEFIPDYKVLGV